MNDVKGSLGAYRVRESFNPSGNELVDKIKRYTADLIDLCEELKRDFTVKQKGSGEAMLRGSSSEEARLASLAQTYYETAAMYAVKAATTEKK